MNKKAITFVMISLLILLASCESKTTGKRVAIPETSSGITGGTTADIPLPPTGETGKTAAETLKELQSMETIPTGSGVKSGTFYPPVTTDATGKEALAEKTDALMRQGTAPTGVQAYKDFGSKYYNKDGPTNLPENYEDNDGD